MYVSALKMALDADRAENLHSNAKLFNKTRIGFSPTIQLQLVTVRIFTYFHCIIYIYIYIYTYIYIHVYAVKCNGEIYGFVQVNLHGKADPIPLSC